MKKWLLFGGSLLMGTPGFAQSGKQLYTQLAAARHDTTRLALYGQLAALYNQRKVADSVYFYVQKGLALARKTRANTYLGELYYQQGNYFGLVAQYEQSIKSYRTAFRYLQRPGGLLRSADVLYALSLVYRQQGNQKLAIVQALENLKYFEKSKAVSQLKATYRLLADIYGTLKEDRLQEFYVDQYLQVSRQLKNPQPLYLALTAKTSLPGSQPPASLPKARVAFRLSRKQVARLTRLLKSEDLQVTLDFKTPNLTTQPPVQPGPKLIPSSVGKKPRLSNAFSATFTQPEKWQQQALIYLHLGLAQRALDAANQALLASRRGKRSDAVLLALKNLITVQEATHRYQEATRTYQAYNRLKDSLQHEHLVRLEDENKLTKKENTILLLHKNIHVQQSKAEQQQQELTFIQQQRLFLVLFLGLLLLLLALLTYFMRRLRRTHALLTGQKKETERQTYHLQEANQFKDKLFSVISHDLRSPVASLKLTFMALKRRNKWPHEMDVFAQQVDALYYTLDNILYWSLNQRNGLRVVTQLVDLSALVNESLNGLKGLVQDRKLFVTFDSSPTYVTLDPTLTLLVLRNILHNAIKFTPEGGFIRVRIHQEEATTYLFVSDTGIGMDLSKKEPTERQNGQGTGLGLQISRELMLRNQGEFRLDSEVGRGTTVILSWSQDAALPDSTLTDAAKDGPERP